MRLRLDRILCPNQSETRRVAHLADRFELARGRVIGGRWCDDCDTRTLDGTAEQGPLVLEVELSVTSPGC